MDRETLLRKISEYTFYQTIDLGNGIKTPGLPTGPKQRQVLAFIDNLDLEGKRVIDIGCANGLFALVAEKAGAEEVLAIDHTKQNIESLETIILPHLKSNIRTKELNILELNSDIHGQFDLAVFAGVLYHLKFPFSALKVIRDIVRDGGTLILETGIFNDFNTRAKLYCPSPEDTPFKGRHANSCSFFNEKALTENLNYFGFMPTDIVHVTNRFRRFLKCTAGTVLPFYYPTSNIVIKCTRDRSIENSNLREFYESRL